MTDAAVAAGAPDPRPRKGKKVLLLISVILAALGAAIGFAVVTLGALPFDQTSKEILMNVSDEVEETTLVRTTVDVDTIAFLPLNAIQISLGAGSARRQLRFVAQLEVPKESAAMVAKLQPRIADVLNGYLRAVGPDDLDDPAALVKLRAQMLRCIKIVSGNQHVRDLLITEFVLN